MLTFLSTFIQACSADRNPAFHLRCSQGCLSTLAPALTSASAPSLFRLVAFSPANCSLAVSCDSLWLHTCRLSNWSHNSFSGAPKAWITRVLDKSGRSRSSDFRAHLHHRIMARMHQPLIGPAGSSKLHQSSKPSIFWFLYETSTRCLDIQDPYSSKPWGKSLRVC